MTQEVRNPACDVRPVSEESVSAVSDRRLQEVVHRALTGSGYRVLTGVEVRVDRGSVKLSGCVPSFYTKQLATTAALNINGVTGLSNELSVVPR